MKYPKETPQAARWHIKRRHTGAFPVCRRCGRDRDVCRIKDQFDKAEVQEMVRETNELLPVELASAWYCCRWCGMFHTTVSKVPRRLKQQLVRQRRKEMFRAELARRAKAGPGASAG